MIRFRISILGVLVVLFSTIPSAFGGLIYDNGAGSTTLGQNYAISHVGVGVDPSVSDTFTLGSSATLMNIDVALWFPTSGSLSTLTYCISTGALCTGSVLDSASGAPLVAIGTVITVSGQYTLEEFGFNVQQLPYTAGTYWLTLSNATPSGGGVTYWDQSNGVGCATAGCPSGAYYSMFELPIAIQGSTVNNRSESLDIYSTPEPATLVMSGGGFLLLAGLLRRFRR